MSYGRRDFCGIFVFYFDEATGQLHIANHSVTEQEVEEVLGGSGEDLKASGSTRRKIGQTESGRILQIFYVADDDPGSLFVITAYDLQGKARLAFRRRQRKQK